MIRCSSQIKMWMFILYFNNGFGETTSTGRPQRSFFPRKIMGDEHTKFIFSSPTKNHAVSCFQWLPNTKYMTHLAQNLTEANWRTIVGFQERQKVTHLFTHPRKLVSSDRTTIYSEQIISYTYWVEYFLISHSSWA